MFNSSFLRVCRILWFLKKLDLAFLSLGGPSPGARVWCLDRVPKHRNHWQEVSSSTRLGIEGNLTCWKDELGNHTLGTKTQNMSQLTVLGG